jgi:hypothetical protein
MACARGGRLRAALFHAPKSDLIIPAALPAGALLLPPPALGEGGHRGLARGTPEDQLGQWRPPLPRSDKNAI